MFTDFQCDFSGGWVGFSRVWEQNVARFQVSVYDSLQVQSPHCTRYNHTQLHTHWQWYNYLHKSCTQVMWLVVTEVWSESFGLVTWQKTVRVSNLYTIQSSLCPVPLRLSIYTSSRPSMHCNVLTKTIIT